MNRDRSITLGHAQHPDAFSAGRLAATQAREQLADDLQPGWALVFCGGRHNPATLLEGLRTVLGVIPIVGAVGVGLITAAAATLNGYECGLLLFADAFAPTAIVVADGLDQDETETGRHLGAQLREQIFPDAAVLLFYDSVKSSLPPVLHVGSRLLDGLYAGLGEQRPTVIGAGALTDMKWSEGFIFDGRQARKHAAVAIVLPPTLSTHITITHGCFPASDFLEITRMDGARVLELDGRPALAVVAERLEVSRAELAARRPLLSLTLGEKYGDPFAPFNENQYVNRLVMTADLADDSLTLFEADFQAGSRVQLMVIDPWRMVESAHHQTQTLLETLDQQTLAFGLYIDCAGRSMAFSGLEDDETAPIREQIGSRCPLLGFYSGVEIAPFLGRARPLDWTGVLALFTVTPHV